MAHSKQALKRARQSTELRVKNRAQNSAVKGQVKRTLTSLDSGDPAKIDAELALAQKQIDKAAKRRVIHPNAAARKKSKLAAMAAAAKKKKPA
jgi:small subunit ribosomal protein S20